MQIYRKASLRAGGASHPSRTFGENLEVITSPSRLDDSQNFFDISSTILPEIYRQSVVRRPIFSLVHVLDRPWPYRVPPAAGESFGAHICPIPCSLCHLMPSHVQAYPHGPPANVATLPAPINGTYSRSKWVVRSEQGLKLEHFSLFQNFQAGWERTESSQF